MSDFHGHKTGVLENSQLRLEYLANTGPRIVRLFLRDNPRNLFGEFPNVGWEIDEGYFHLLGGHRLWAAPEKPGISYLPDVGGLTLRELPSGVEMIWEPKKDAGLAKSIRIELIEQRPVVQIVHTIINHFDHQVRVAPWGITVFPLGGSAYLPSRQNGNGSNPESNLVIWPYSHRKDPRLALNSMGIKVKAKEGLPPLKVGGFADSGCCAYYNDGVLFVKTRELLAGEYPDNNCNVEAYCSDLYIELETLAPLRDLAPGDSVSSAETWELFVGDSADRKLEQIFPNGSH